MPEIHYDQRYTEYQLSRSRLRRFVRRAYLRKAVSNLHGPTIDLGCGVGELLELLPEGSRGLEYNHATVAYCQRKGLAVEWYDGFADDWALSNIAKHSGYRSLVISHVLEHLQNPAEVLAKLLRASAVRGISNVLVIVPCESGFRSDPTHVTFVDLGLVERAAFGANWNVAKSFFFPINLPGIGRWFVHHELQVVLCP